MRWYFLILALPFLLLSFSCKGKKEKIPQPKVAEKQAKPVSKTPDIVKKMLGNLAPKSYVQNELKKLTPVRISYPKNLLSSQEQKVVELFYKAANYIDEIFLRQAYKYNTYIKANLPKLPKPHAELFKINYLPFNRLDEFKAFIGVGIAEHPKGANFYPENLTKTEFENYLKKHPEEAEKLKSPYTVVKREAKKLVAIPYSQEYKDLLEPAAKALEEAAKLLPSGSLKKFVLARAKAFRTNNYRESDALWVDVKDGKLELTIGPYEVYEDGLMNYKAAFEAFIHIIDTTRTQEIQHVRNLLPEMDKNLPMPKELLKNMKPKKKTLTPVLVTHMIYNAGDARKGVQTLAYVLPNDEKVRAEKGSKKIMMFNVIKAKFDHILKPIAKIVLGSANGENVLLDSFFLHTVMHEMSHTVGPGIIYKDGKEMQVNEALKEAYSTIEECKADTLAAYFIQFFKDKGEFKNLDEQKHYNTYVAGLFRSMRFGKAEAHAKANYIQFNYIREKGGIKLQGDHYILDIPKLKQAIKSLAKEVLTIEAKGDYAYAVRFINTYTKETVDMTKMFEKIKKVPVDIRPIFELDELLKAK